MKSLFEFLIKTNAKESPIKLINSYDDLTQGDYFVVESKTMSKLKRIDIGVFELFDSENDIFVKVRISMRFDKKGKELDINEKGFYYKEIIGWKVELNAYVPTQDKSLKIRSVNKKELDLLDKLIKHIDSNNLYTPAPNNNSQTIAMIDNNYKITYVY